MKEITDEEALIWHDRLSEEDGRLVNAKYVDACRKVSVAVVLAHFLKEHFGAEIRNPYIMMVAQRDRLIAIQEEYIATYSPYVFTMCTPPLQDYEKFSEMTDRITELKNKL